jgi:subfamily B ATP-binding cassette protein MsbA
METTEDLQARSSSIRARRRIWSSELAPLARLLSYVPPHRKYALLTVVFGTSGFLLSFAYPWIIGSVIDLITGKAWSHATADERWQRLLWLTELATATAVLHAAVLYGRGHFSTSLGDAIVTDLRKQLFNHLQKLSVGFYTRERTGAILSRVLHDVHDATAVLYMGVIVVFLDAAQLLIAFILLSGISLKLTLAAA